MKVTRNLSFAFGLLMWLSIASVPTLHAAWQTEEGKTDESKQSEQDDENVVSTATLIQDAPEVDDRFLRFEMWDGTVVSGIVSIGSVDVETEFGSLEIPISRLIDFRPGLNSLPELKAKVDDLVLKLGDREFKTREAAHRDLVAMGPMLAGMISSMDDGGDAERKKHITKIKQEIDSMMDEEEDEDASGQPSLTSGDRVQTPDFAIVGKIVQQEFQVKSKIGDLRIMLGDVKRADRGVAVQTQSLRKTVSVAGQTFFQKKPVNTKIRVSKGDRITISATGVVQWTNWNQTASPDGLPNQGNWNGISNGALAARIGSDGTVVSVGSDKSFKAERSGILYLAIAMNDNYVRNTGYRWTGTFKAKIKVAPAAE